MYFFSFSLNFLIYSLSIPHIAREDGVVGKKTSTKKNQAKNNPKKQLSLYFLQQKKENKKKRLDENVPSRHK